MRIDILRCSDGTLVLALDGAGGSIEPGRLSIDRGGIVWQNNADRSRPVARIPSLFHDDLARSTSVLVRDVSNGAIAEIAVVDRGEADQRP